MSNYASQIDEFINSSLSNFSGEGDQYAMDGDGYMDADGTTDYFGNQLAGLDQSINLERTFGITVTNLLGTNETLRLFYPATYSAAVQGSTTATNGCVRTSNSFASTTDTAAAFRASSTATGGLTIENFIAWTHANPTRLNRMSISTTNGATQFAFALNIQKVSPWEVGATRTLPFNAVQSEFAFNANRLTIDINEQLDSQTDITITIPAGVTTTFTFICGMAVNAAKGLAKMADRSQGRVNMPLINNAWNRNAPQPNRGGARRLPIGR